jgi:hypothetical protein
MKSRIEISAYLTSSVMKGLKKELSIKNKPATRIAQVAGFLNAHMMGVARLLSDYLILNFFISMGPDSRDVHEFFGKLEETVFLTMLNDSNGVFRTDFA